MVQLSRNETDAVMHSYLFQGVKEEQMRSMLGCLNAEKRSYEKRENIIRVGDPTGKIGMVLEGCADISRDDYWGNRHIISAVRPSECFGESYAVMHGGAMRVNVQATADTVILFLDMDHILRVCSSACTFHSQIIRNLVTLLSSRNLALNDKMTHITQHTLREKLLSYLSAESLRHHSSYFDIPFDRQQLADYLNADRSAVSGELSRMKKEGLLDYQKNHFRLLAGAAGSTS